MTAAVLTRPAQPLPLDVLQADLRAIDTAILSLSLGVVEATGHRAFLLGRYLAAAVARRAEVEAEIANVSTMESSS